MVSRAAPPSAAWRGTLHATARQCAVQRGPAMSCVRPHPNRIHTSAPPTPTPTHTHPSPRSLQSRCSGARGRRYMAVGRGVPVGGVRLCRLVTHAAQLPATPTDSLSHPTPSALPLLPPTCMSDPAAALPAPTTGSVGRCRTGWVAPAASAAGHGACSCEGGSELNRWVVQLTVAVGPARDDVSAVATRLYHSRWTKRRGAP